MADNNHDDFVEDNFEDEPKSDEVDGADGEWADDDEYADDASAEDVVPPPKKKSNLSNIIIVAVVLILAVGYFMFAGGSAEAPTSSETEVAADGESAPASDGIDLAPPAAVVADAPADASAPADQGFLVESNPEALVTDIPIVKVVTPQPELPTAVENAPEPSAALPDNAPTTAPAEAAVATGAAEDTTAATAAEFPTVNKILKPQADTDVEKAVEPAVVPTEAVITPALPAVVDGTPVSESADLAAQLAEEQAKSADLQKRLEAAQNVAEKANANEVEALKVKIAGLEQQLLSKTANENSSETVVTKPEAVENAMPEERPVVRKNVRQDAPVVKIKPTSKWVLKAASSGRALIAHAGGADLRTVYVGDTVEPIGRIVAIEKSSSGWKVKGTKATISQ